MPTSFPSSPAGGTASKASIDFITGNGTSIGHQLEAAEPHFDAPNTSPKGYLSPAHDSTDHRMRSETTAAQSKRVEAKRNSSSALDEQKGTKEGAGMIVGGEILREVSREEMTKGGETGQIPSSVADPKIDAQGQAGTTGGAASNQLPSQHVGGRISTPSSHSSNNRPVGADEAARRSPMYYTPGRPIIPSVSHDRRDQKSNTSTRASLSSSRSERSSSVYSAKSELPPLKPVRASTSLDNLPHNVLARIAYHIITTSPSSHPGSLSAALASCKTFHQAASFEANPRLYHDLFSHTFDLAALRRRYEWMKKRLVQARMAAIANESVATKVQRSQDKEVEERRGAGLGQVGSGGLQEVAPTPQEGKPRNGPPKPVQTGNPPHSGSPSSTAAKSGSSDTDKPIISPAAMSAKQAFDLFDDPRSWAMDYKERWITAKRMRLNVRAHSMVVQGKCNREDMMADLWNIWFMLTENDGKNLHFLAEQCHFVSWMSVYNDDMIQTDAATPGYPEESGAKALGVWIALISGTDLVSEQSANQVDEKIFTLRPYVFACAKYEILYARWTMRHLPLSVLAGGVVKGQGQAGAGNGVGTLPGGIAESPGPSKAVPYKRFGYTWRRAPPNHILGSYLYFLRLLDRQPNRRLSASSPSTTTSAGPSPSFPLPGLFNSSRILPSQYHDREWQRNSVCQDPSSSPGLPALTFKGELEGYWRGKFLFYDFDMYRRVLAGDVRAVYTGKFAEQHLELELRETVIRVPMDKVGGAGLAVCAGFKDEAEGEMPDEIKRIREGYGYEMVPEEEMQLEKQQGPHDKPGWTKEILLSGYGRTSWGLASIRGRVRAWDGMIVLQMAYSRQPMERWVWRGYLHTGGYLLGMWRDSFSPEHQRGYEGPFGIVRAGDVSYPPHLPTAMSANAPSVQHVFNGQLPAAAGTGQAPTPNANTAGPTNPAVGPGQNGNVPLASANGTDDPSTAIPLALDAAPQAQAITPTPTQAAFGAMPGPAVAAPSDTDMTPGAAGRMQDAEQQVEADTAGSISVQPGASVQSPSVGSSNTPVPGSTGVFPQAMESLLEAAEVDGRAIRAEKVEMGKERVAEGEEDEGQARKRARKE